MNLCQYFTPTWLAEALVDRYFPRLDCADMVLDPSCGVGAFLNAIPASVPAIGCEIDPVIAEQARKETGRPVVTGDFRTVSLDVTPTCIIGNPPFRMDVVDGFLDRARQLLPEGGRAGLLLPAYAFQTAARVAQYADIWSIAVELIPRNAFPRLREPLVFALFSKDRCRTLVGVALYRETDDALSIAAPYRALMRSTSGSLWRAVCGLALQRLGGEADLPAIYSELEGNRPSRTQFWKEKVRQTLRQYRADFIPIKAGRYALARAAA